MKHYRILERKGDKKEYIIQYLKKFIFGLYFWKKVDNTIYNKYEEALNGVKKIINQNDYETPTLGFHYIDAYKIFKYSTTKEAENTSVKMTPTNKINKSTLAQGSEPKTKVNKSVFIPKQK